ncbi:hypothetical protein K469DRAFT_714164 [Zopfia rhizophila CBS 207.26]|uniref:EH domain-containing protein n=1 Tax=Zopfia rhizophila CBS 207.26 TaxID=1314779 RepID=A0A6A6DRW6_9PEZI|nr:hypothetical protein K469DRAFT_714164 [Zopfia rhizophila CBS 207.26]
MTSANSSRNNPLPTQTTGDTQYNVRDAALLGASSAFSKPVVKPIPQVNTYTGGNNGALLAATKVGTGAPRTTIPQSSTSPLRRDWTGGSVSNRPTPPPMQLLSKSSSSTLDVPVDALSDRTPSPSNIAAKLAASRYSPMKPVPQLTPMSITNERDLDERDILPPAGSVGSAMARLNIAHQQPLKRRTSIGSQSSVSTLRDSRGETKGTDDTPIPPTTSLVNMFEQNRPTTSMKPRTESVVSQRTPPPVRSPKPQRKVMLPLQEPKEIDILDGSQEETKSVPRVKPKPKRELTLPTQELKANTGFSNLRKDSLGTPPIKRKPSQLTAVKTTAPHSKPPRSRGSRPKSHDLTRSPFLHERFSTSMDSNDNVSSPSSYASAPEEQVEEKPKPNLPPPRRSMKAKSESNHLKAPEGNPRPSPLPPKPRSPNKIPSATTPPETFTLRPPASAYGSSPQSDTTYHSPYQRESSKAIAKHMTGELLSNAIVGAALASSRNPSPAPSSTAAPPLPIRKQHHHHHPFHHSRSPSPPKSSGKLRSTMRKEPSSSSDEDESEKYKRKGTRVLGMGRKHPNKHHEGARKRWRDTITERERKRYEGVWAANKGLHIAQPSSLSPPSPDSSDPMLEVLNLVVKELWGRSRLPEHVLEEVWALVDGKGVGRLRREEFVVGMWLIDQRLKGRKLPVKVSESVWGSVRGVGVRVVVKPKS